MSFRFRYFSVEDSNSTMKVGTDSMLLGSWADPAWAGAILDVGTGCGVLALMMAQKSGCPIDAIDIHQPSAEEAGKNFLASPWAGRINVFHTSFREFSENTGHRYSLIITNPPFFSNSLKPASASKLISRHEQSLGLIPLIDCSVTVMTPDALLYLVLPASGSSTFLRQAAIKNLFPRKIMQIRPCPARPPNRVLLSMGFDSTAPCEAEELSISTPGGKFTAEYLALTRDFHFFAQKDS